MSFSNIRIVKSTDDDETSREHEEAVLELQRLLACYQIASFDDKKVVWAVLNKYAKNISL